jgi:hypothetical protein
MGSTVFVQAKVWSFPTQNGRTGYVWAENTYEKKEGPKHASWCVMGLGYRQQMINRIFALAASIPGGMLIVNRSSARSFITAMLAQLETPQQLTSTKMVLRNSSKGWYELVNDQNRAAVRALLHDHGKDALAEAIKTSLEEGGEPYYEIDLATDLDLAIALTSRQGGEEQIASPWQIVRSVPRDSHPATTHTDSAPPYRGAVDLTLHGLGVETAFPLRLCLLDGQPVHVGCDYMVEQALIKKCAEKEMTHPGYYKTVLGEYQKLSKATLPPMPETTVFDVDATRVKWQGARDIAEKISESIHGMKSATFSLSLKEAQSAAEAAKAAGDQSRLYHLSSTLSSPELTTVRFGPREETDEDDETTAPAPSNFG